MIEVFIPTKHGVICTKVCTVGLHIVMSQRWIYTLGYLKTSKHPQRYLHSLIVGAKMFVTTYVDHINRDRLDNRLENLRIVDSSINGLNKERIINKKYRGTYYEKRTNKYCARIKVSGKWWHLGTHLTEIDAAKAYNKAALEAHGEYALLNEV